MRCILIVLLALLVCAPVFGGSSGYRVYPVTIASGEALTEVLDLRGGTVVALHLPASWTASNLTFQACTSSAAASCSDLYDTSRTEVTITVGSVSAASTVYIPPSTLTGLQYIRIRSGVTATPVNQAAARQIGVAVREF